MQHDLPTLLFVRDPRDALYSQWRRLRSYKQIPNQMTFVQFVDSPFFDQQTSWRRYLQDFWSSWVATTPNFLRYEDYRTKPIATLNRALEFLELACADLDIQDACSKSDVSVAQAIEAQRTESGTLKYRLNHAGIAYEYKNHFSLAMHDAIGPYFDDFCQKFGYASYEQARVATTKV